MDGNENCAAKVGLLCQSYALCCNSGSIIQNNKYDLMHGGWHELESLTVCRFLLNARCSYKHHGSSFQHGCPYIVAHSYTLAMTKNYKGNVFLF